MLCRVVHKDSGFICFVPGIVLMLPCRPDNNFFTVRLYTAQRVSADGNATRLQVKSSAVAEMGDRLATIGMGRSV